MKKTNGALSPNMLRNVDAYWRAANYLSVGQIYLLNNPLLKEPLRHEHIKPRLLGHWAQRPVRTSFTSVLAKSCALTKSRRS